MVGLVDRLIPNQELEERCRLAWYWKQACEKVAGHRAHALVTVLDTRLDGIDAALLATQTMAALMTDENAVASYWGVNLQSREQFLKSSAKATRRTPPVLLWISYRLSRDAQKGWSISTRGMKQFDLMEVECKDAQVDPRELFMLVGQTTEYLIAEGAIIRDGDTIGDSPALNIRVRHAPSYWNEGQTVYRIEFPAQSAGKK